MASETKIFKFGGASVRDAERIKNVGHILNDYKDQPIVIVISAMGKITNALEEVVKAFQTSTMDAAEALQKVKTFHATLLKELFQDDDPIYPTINDTFVEIDWMIEEEFPESFDYAYDQIVSVGELLSTKIVAAYLNNIGIKNTWLDARDIIQTDNTYRDGRVNWQLTKERTKSTIPTLLEKGLVITQGFIGSTSENFTTTLGREGSDYSAAIIGYCLDAGSVSIWKDVPGILTGDPKLFEDVEKIDQLSYREAIEMTYYGAKVIHPKTIKPLQNKAIPLHVKCFLDKEGSGTIISNEEVNNYPSIVVVEHNQCMLHISVNDFSFVAEHHLSEIFTLLAKHRIKVNLMRNTAIS
ncbi:MAG: aspartate kinase, partial [Bacteroidota bacterium]